MAKFRAKYAFHGEQADDLSFQVNDIIWVYDRPANGWWFGRTEDGRQGIFPYNRVEEIPEQDMGFSLDAFVTGGPAQSSKKSAAPAAAPVKKDDSLMSIQIDIRTPVPLYDQEFQVKATISNGNTIVGLKKMRDFRVLNEALGQMNGKPEAIIGLDRTERVNASIPMWADKIKLDEQFAEAKMVDRASILSDWLGQRIRQKGADDYLIASWVDSNIDFYIAEGTKKDAEAHLRTAASKLDKVKMEPPRLAITLYKWLKREDNDITLEKNEILRLCNESEFNGWYVGEKVNGDKGLFPFNYVKELTPDEHDEILHPEKVKKKKKPLPDVPVRKPRTESFGEFGQQFGLGTKNDTNVYQPVTQVQTPAFIPSNTLQRKDQKPRARKKFTKYKLSCIEAFDQLIDDGVTVEQDGKLADFSRGGEKPKNGDTVTIYYSGYIWEPQKQELLEFASSDKLQGSDEAGGPLVFKLGANLAIDGIEEVAGRMSLGQKVRVTLAPEKAYGDVGMPPQIPGNAYLVYDLSLEHIDRGGAGGAGRNAGAQRGKVMNRAASSRQQFNDYQTPAPNADRDKFKRKLPLAHLQKIVQTRTFADYGIDHRIIQEYLTEEDFLRTFQIDRNKWNFLPVYSQNEMLRQAGLK